MSAPCRQWFGSQGVHLYWSRLSTQDVVGLRRQRADTAGLGGVQLVLAGQQGVQH